MNKMYRVKEGTDLNVFGQMGWDIDGETIYNIIEKPVNSFVVQNILKNLYNSPQWKERFYSQNKEALVQNIGIKYDKNGLAVLKGKFKEIITNWRLEFEFGDESSYRGIIGFTSTDPFSVSYFYNSQILDQCFEEQIKELYEKDLIEEVDADNNFQIIKE